jgi:hypothetical protein
MIFLIYLSLIYIRTKYFLPRAARLVRARPGDLVEALPRRFRRVAGCLEDQDYRRDCGRVESDRDDESVQHLLGHTTSPPNRRNWLELFQPPPQQLLGNYSGSWML